MNIPTTIIEHFTNATTSVDIISTNGDIVLGMPSFIVLCTVTNRNCNIRFLQSKEESFAHDYNVDRLLYDFYDKAKRAFIYNHTEYSLAIIDKEIALIFKDGQSTIEEIDLSEAYERFNPLWEEYSERNFIRSVGDVILDASGVKKGDMVFRGQVNHKWEAIPALLRDNDPNAPLIETKYLKPLLQRSYFPYVDSSDPLAFLTVCQHYKIKTRLLDFTRDVLIALFFACYDPENRYSDEHGKLYSIFYNHYNQVDYNGAIVDVFRRAPTAEDTQIYIDRIHKSYHCIFEPMVKNPRMRIQEGLFMLFSFCKDSNEYVSLEKYTSLRNKDIHNDDEKFWLAFKLVDRKFKKIILSQLKNEYGIDETTVFCDFKYSNDVESLIASALSISSL